MFDHCCCQLWGTGARAPLDFQLCNFSGHFRAAQTLTFESMPSQYKNKQTRSFVTVYGMDFIFLCVIHKLFSLSFMFPLHQILVMPLCLKLQNRTPDNAKYRGIAMMVYQYNIQAYPKSIQVNCSASIINHTVDSFTVQPHNMTWNCKLVQTTVHLCNFNYYIGIWANIINRDHSFPRQIFPNSAGQFTKFRGSPWQIFHI